MLLITGWSGTGEGILACLVLRGQEPLIAPNACSETALLRVGPQQ
jgi:hypothetical protein